MSERTTELVRDVLDRFEALKQERAIHEETWSDIAEHVLPRIADISFDWGDDQHEMRIADNFDSTGRNAVRLWSNGMQGHMTPRMSPWVKVTLPDRTLRSKKGVRKYLQEVSEILLAELRRSNLYDELTPTFEHGVTVGTATLTVGWDRDEGKLMFRSRHPKQVYLAENAIGKVDTVFTVEQMSWRQILQAFGDKELEEADLEAAERRPYDKQEVLHAVYPRTDRVKGKTDVKNKKFASIWILTGKEILLREHGLDQLRDIAWRYRVGPGSAYGTSPAHDALIDVLRADKVSETMLRAADLAVRPPLQYPAELEGRLKLNPHGMTPYYDGRRKIETIGVTGAYPWGVEMMDRLRDAVREHFHIDFWLMLTQRDGTKTAYEVSQLAGEKAAVMGTEIGRVESELLDPLLDVCVTLLGENGRLPEAPAGLEREIAAATFSYDGPLAQLQKRHYGQQSLIQMLSQVTLIGQVFPRSLQWINDDELMKQALQALEAPESTIRDDNDVEQIRAQEAQMQQQMMQLEMAKQSADLQATLAKARKDDPAAQTPAGRL